MLKCSKSSGNGLKPEREGQAASPPSSAQRCGQRDPDSFPRLHLGAYSAQTQGPSPPFLQLALSLVPHICLVSGSSTFPFSCRAFPVCLDLSGSLCYWETKSPMDRNGQALGVFSERDSAYFTASCGALAHAFLSWVSFLVIGGQGPWPGIQLFFSSSIL